MPSTSQLTQNSRSMNGLNTINANAVFTDTLEVNTITIDTAGTVPTRPSGDSTLNIANTQFVSNAVATAGANYVDLTSTQTITGAKTFSNANTVVSGNLITNSIVSASATTDINIGTALTTGDINMGTTASGGQNVALNWGSGSNSGQLTFQGGSFTLGSSGNYNQYSGAIFDTNISTNQTSGVLNIATGGSKTGGINIGTGASAKTIVLGDGSLGTTVIRGQFAQLRPSQSGACNVGDNMTSGSVIIGRGDTTASSTTINIGNGTLFTGAINVGAGTSGNAPITIGSTASTTQTATHNAITTFSKIPSCAVAPTTADHLCNKTYVDSVASGGGVTLNTTQTITGEKTFSNANTFITGNLNAPTITTTVGTSMTIETDPSGFSDNINMYSNNEVTLNSGYSTNINGGTFVTSTAGTGLYLTTNGSAGLNLKDNFGGAIGINFTGTNITFNNTTGKTDFNGNVNVKNASTLSVGTGTTTFAGGAVDVSGGKLTSGGQFALKSGGSDRLTIDHSFGLTTIRIKTAGQALNIGMSDNTNYAMQINDTTGAGTYQKSAIFIPDQATFSLIPSGTIMMNVTNSVPNGYVYCDGTGYSTANVATNKYYTLFTTIGYAFGGSGGTFNVPNFKGAFLRGEGSQVVGGITYSAGTRGTAQPHQLQDHKHTYSDMMWWDTDTGGGSGQTIYVAGTDYQVPGGDTVGSNGDGNFSNRLTKATYPATAVNPGTPAQQYSAPTNVSALTGDNTYPMNYSVYYIIKI